jgi:uncharacterized protein (DUF58 family)
VHAPAIGVVGLGVLLAVLARTTGSGWLVVIASGLAALLVIGALAPALALARVRLTMSVPRDATAGRSFVADLHLAGRGRDVRVRGDVPAAEWCRADAPMRGRFRARLDHRGVYPGGRVELRSASPFGFVSWRRVDPVAFDRPVEVAPEPVEVAALTGAAALGEGVVGGRAAPVHGELTRGVRPYARGDPRRLVHHPATARWATTMVRELEAPPGPRLVLVVDLGPAPPTHRARAVAPGGVGPGTRADAPDDAPDDARERAASEAFGIAREGLRLGRPVVLATAEATGPVLGRVTSERAAGRRLARAVAGTPAVPRVAPGDELVRVTASPRTPR